MFDIGGRDLLSVLAVAASLAGCTTAISAPDAGALSPAPAGPETVFKAYSPFLTARGEGWRLVVRHRHLDQRLVYQLDSTNGGRLAEGMFMPDPDHAYPLHYAAESGDPGRLEVEVEESGCVDATGPHELRVRIHMDDQAFLPAGCGDFHLPDPP